MGELIELQPDERSPDERLHDAVAAARQVGLLEPRGADPAFWRLLALRLEQRRERRDDVVRFHAWRQPAGPPVLTVPNELLVDARWWDQASGRVPTPLSGEPVDTLDGRVIRVRLPQSPPGELVDVARTLRQLGAPVALHHVLHPAPWTPHAPPVRPSRRRRRFPWWGGASSDAQPVRVAILDTGVSTRTRDDGWLTGLPASPDDIDPLDAFPEPDGTLDLAAGHGTFVAGIVEQVAPLAEVHPYRVLDSDGIGSEVDVATSLVRAAAEGASILHVSAGTHTLDDQPLLAVDAALRLVAEQNDDVVVLAGAGNTGTSRPYWPASARGVVAVGGLTADLRPARWSNHGHWVDCSAVAQGVESTYVVGEQRATPDGLLPDSYTFTDDPWAIWSGTSLAAAQVAAALARLTGDAGGSPRAALRRLLRQGVPVPGLGVGVQILPGN